MKNIIKLIKELQPLQKNAVRQVKFIYGPEVERIISERVKDISGIERALDSLLDFAFDPDVLALFKKLCRYYYQIDPQATTEYVLIYRDLWDEQYQAKHE